MRVARPDAQASHRRSRVERRAVSSKVEPTTGSPDHGPRLFRASLHDGETAWSGSNSQGLGRNDGGVRNGNPGGPENPDTAKATGVWVSVSCISPRLSLWRSLHAAAQASIRARSRQ